MSTVSLQMVDTNNLAPYKNIVVNKTNYIFGHQIAKGGFSTIYEAIDSWENSLAVKIYDKRVDKKLFENEVIQLKKFASNNVVHLYDAFSYEEFNFIIMERFGFAISRIKTDNFDKRVEIFIRCAKVLLETLHNIHKEDYIHGDINPNNLLINFKDSELLGVKLCDFTFCRKTNFIEQKFMTIANWIISPECYYEKIENITNKMDIYHAGLLLYSILKEEKISYTKEEVLSNKPQIDVLNSDIPLIRALASALNVNPESRITALQLWRNILESK